MSMGYIAAIVGIGSAAYGVISGSRQKRKADKELEYLNANQPVEKLPTEVKKNQELASLRSKTGLPAEQYAMAMKNIQRQQAKTLRGASDRRMGLGLLASVDDNANRATANLDAENANARLRNEKTLMDTNSQVANWKKGIYDRNVRQVWDRNFDYNMALKGQGNQNISNGITSGINAAASGLGAYYGSGGNNSRWARGLFSTKKNKLDFSGGGNDYNTDFNTYG